MPTVTIAAHGEADRAIVMDMQNHELAWLLHKIVKPLNKVDRPYSAYLCVYEGDVTHKCSEEEWCDQGCSQIGSVDYNKTLKDLAARSE